MRKLFRQSKTVLATVAVIGAVSLSSYAADAGAAGSDSLSGSGDILKKIYSEIKGFLDKNLEEKQPYFEDNKTDIRNNLLPVVLSDQSNNTRKSVSDLIMFMIGPQIPLPGNISMFEMLQKTMLSIKGADVYIPKGGTNIFGGGGENETTQRICGNLNFNFQSLIGPNAYTEKAIPDICGGSKQQESSFAQNFILSISDMGQPVSDFSPAKALEEGMVENEQQAKELSEHKAYIEFMMQRRYIVATRSIGLSNLYYLYNQRVSKYTVGDKPMSQMEIYNQNATSRIGNAKWYSDMIKAYPAQLAREQVFILAEMQQELHQMNVVMQRQLATQSAQVMQAASMGTQLLQINMQKIEEAINEIKQKSAAEEAAKERN